MRWRLRTNRPPETVRGRFDARVDDTKAQETGAGAAFSSVTMAALMPGGSTGEGGHLSRLPTLLLCALRCTRIARTGGLKFTPSTQYKLDMLDTHGF